MVGRALDGEVERDLEAEGPRALDEAVEVVERAELRMHRGVAALRAADRPWAPGVAGRGGERVVASLAVRAPDRVDRRQVDDVEAHRRHALELRLRVLEGSAGAREELVPGGDARALAVGHHLVLALRPRRLRAVEVSAHQRGELGIARPRDRRRRAGGAGDPLGELAEPPVVAPPRARRRRADQVEPLPELAGQILAGRVARAEVRQPRAEGLGERLEREDPARVGVEREGARPAVVVDVPHRRLAPLALVDPPVLQKRDEHVVAFLEDVGGDLQHAADLALDRIPATVDRGGDVLDDDRATRVLDRPRAHGARLKPSASASGPRARRASGPLPRQSSKKRFCVAQWP